MSVFKYVASLLPSFKKNRLLEDTRIVRTELQNTTIPAYKAAQDYLNNKVKSKEIKAFEKEYFKYLGQTNSKGIVFDISYRMQQIESTVAKIEDLVEKEFEEEIVVGGITLFKTSLIKSVDLMRFVSRYSLKLLNYFYILETIELTGEQHAASTMPSKGDINDLKTGMFAFASAMKAFTQGHKDFTQVIKQVPDVLVNENTQATLATFDTKKIDPTGIMGIQHFSMNPIYHVGLIVAEYQSTRYKEQQELKLNLELRLMNLKMAQSSGENDPGLDKEIQITQSRIDKLSESLRKHEESVGI